VGVEQAQLQPAFTGARWFLQAKQDGESVFPSARPAVLRPGMYIRPIAFGVGFPDNEKAVLFELPELVRRQGELGIIAVRFANLPKQSRKPRKAPGTRERGATDGLFAWYSSSAGRNAAAASC
jgi:hypothetical protein